MSLSVAASLCAPIQLESEPLRYYIAWTRLLLDGLAAMVRDVLNGQLVVSACVIPHLMSDWSFAVDKLPYTRHAWANTSALYSRRKQNPTSTLRCRKQLIYFVYPLAFITFVRQLTAISIADHRMDSSEPEVSDPVDGVGLRVAVPSCAIFEWAARDVYLRDSKHFYWVRFFNMTLLSSVRLRSMIRLEFLLVI